MGKPQNVIGLGFFHLAESSSRPASSPSKPKHASSSSFAVLLAELEAGEITKAAALEAFKEMELGRRELEELAAWNPSHPNGPIQKWARGELGE